MALGVRTYDASQVVIVVNGNAIGGYADGTFIELERELESYTKVVGADGTTSRAKTNNLSGSITITLAQTSPSNDVLSALHDQDQTDNTAIFPIIVKDMMGNSQMFSGTGWVEGLPKTDYGKDIANRQWKIHVSHMQYEITGNLGVGT